MMVQAFLGKCSADDKAMLKNLFDAMGMTILKHDGWEDESQVPLMGGQKYPDVDQAFKLAAFILCG